MNDNEAKEILNQHLARYRGRTYAELRNLIDESETIECSSPSGVTYQIQTQVFWDDEAEGSLRVMGAIDDVGRRALSPLCDDFIMTPNGSLIDE
jgi:hypothetical protein